MYGIEISYSWGENEGCYGEFPTEELAYKEMCNVAAKEAYVQNQEFLPENTCSVQFDAANKSVDLHYDYDDTWCHYRVVKRAKKRSV